MRQKTAEDFLLKIYKNKKPRNEKEFDEWLIMESIRKRRLNELKRKQYHKRRKAHGQKTKTFYLELYTQKQIETLAKRSGAKFSHIVAKAVEYYYTESLKMSALNH